MAELKARSWRTAVHLSKLAVLAGLSSAEQARSLPEPAGSAKPKPGQHRGERKRRDRKPRRLPKWLRLARHGAHLCARVLADFWRDAATDNTDLLDRWEALFKPITGPTAVSLPRLSIPVPVARVAGAPPWAISEGGSILPPNGSKGTAFRAPEMASGSAAAQ